MAVVGLRRARHTYRQISQALPVAPNPVARLLHRAGLHRLAELGPARPLKRYEYDWPGDLLHPDIKKLDRFWRPGHGVTGDGRSAQVVQRSRLGVRPSGHR